MNFLIKIYNKIINKHLAIIFYFKTLFISIIKHYQQFNITILLNIIVIDDFAIFNKNIISLDSININKYNFNNFNNNNNDNNKIRINI